MDIELHSHRAYPTLPEDQIGREAGKAFACGLEDPDIKIQLLLGGKKTVNEALQQALDLQGVLLAASPHKTIRTFWGSRSPATRQRDARKSTCWTCGEPATSKVTTHKRQRLIRIGAGNMMTYQAETHGNRQGGLNGDQVGTKKQTWVVANRRETSVGLRRKGGCGRIH
jgi:hypothetical protein